MDTTNTVLLMGRPGSGKGTQAALLTEMRGWKNFSTGNLFKQIRDEDSAIGNRVREAYDAGKLLPDWFATYLFEHEMLNLPAGTGIVCEGYPRSRAQAEIFDDIMSWLSRPYAVLNLVVSEEETMRRMIERSKVEHRPDSATEELIRVRFNIYETNTAPVLDLFREKGMLIEINGEQSVEEVTGDIEKALESL